MSEDCQNIRQADYGSNEFVSADGVIVSPTLWMDRCWKFLVAGAMYIVLFREELARLLDSWSTANGSHGWLIPGFSIYFLYQDRHRLNRDVGRPNYLGVLLILASVLLYVYFFYVGIYYPRQIMMLVLLAGVVLLLGGWQVVKVVWLPVAFLIFAMPLPARLYYNLTMPMRELASMVAAGLLNALPGITCEAMGVVIDGARKVMTGGITRVENFSLNVAEACSGMRLLLAFVALGVAMAYLEYRPILHRLILLASTLPIAILCNMLRVLLTGLIHIYIGAQYATGMLHTVLGMVMLGVAFGLYGLLAWVMSQIFVTEEQAEEILVVDRANRPDKK